MPIQPRSPTLFAKAGTSVSSRFGLKGENVPAEISSARKARTSLRNCSHSGGRRIGSKRRAAVMIMSRLLKSLFASARGDQRPQFVGAPRGDALAEFHRPVALRAEIVAP